VIAGVCAGLVLLSRLLVPGGLVRPGTGAAGLGAAPHAGGRERHCPGGRRGTDVVL